MRRSLAFSAILASLVVLSIHAQQSAAVTPATPAVLAQSVVRAFSSALPVFAEHRYRMAAKVRPLLLFWVGRDNVGGARILWRRSPDNSRGWDLLIGSDPGRAPTHVNRWGYIREEVTGGDVTMLGVMKQSDEQSLEEARAHVENESAASYPFKLIRTRVAEGESTATVTSGAFSRDFTYHDLQALLRGFDEQPVRTSAPKQVRVGQNTKPGFLVAIADLIHDSVWAFHRSGAAGLTARSVTYAYNGRLYDLVLAKPRVLRNAEYGGQAYPTLIDADFEVRNRANGGKEQFSVVYGTEGRIEEVPVYIAYQPRWWLKAELLLDEKQAF